MGQEKVSMLRYRGSKLDKVKELDFFPKVEDGYKETSSVGGTVTVISFMLISWLVYSEVKYYLDSRFIFKFSPDTDIEEKLKINVDLTVAMPCQFLGADILDSTNQNAYKFGSLDEEDTWFELDSEQRNFFEGKRHFNSYLREEYHAIKLTVMLSARGLRQLHLVDCTVTAQKNQYIMADHITKYPASTNSRIIFDYGGTSSHTAEFIKKIAYR